MKEVRSFLGRASFYGHFIKDLSKITKSMTNLLAKDVPFHLSEECLVALLFFILPSGENHLS